MIVPDAHHPSFRRQITYQMVMEQILVPLFGTRPSTFMTILCVDAYHNDREHGAGKALTEELPDSLRHTVALRRSFGTVFNQFCEEIPEVSLIHLHFRLRQHQFQDRARRIRSWDIRIQGRCSRHLRSHSGDILRS